MMRTLKDYFAGVIPHVGMRFDWSPLGHLGRDIMLALILRIWHCSAWDTIVLVMTASGFFEAGNGVAYDRTGKHDFFDLLDFFPSALAGFIVFGFKPELLAAAIIAYGCVAGNLLILNLILRREFLK